MNEPPVFDDPEDGAEVDPEELKRLQAQAHALGLHINSNDPIEIAALVALASKERGSEHPVPCYGLSYDPTDRRCRICQLRSKCADLDKSPRVEVTDLAQLQPVTCDVCAGQLEVELLDREQKQVRDYGCTTMGCCNTLGVQCGWETHAETAVRDIVLPKEQEAQEAEAAEQEAAEAEPEAGESVPPADPPPAPPKPKKKKATKKTATKGKPKVVVKKKGAKKKATKKKVVKAAPASKLVFIYDNEPYATLTPIAVAISGSRNWSGKRFFRVKGDLEAGMVLEREWEGQTYTVRVEKE